MPGGSSDPRARALQGDDPRLQKMPDRPTLLDFFKYRWGTNAHLLQSATHALKAGCDEKTVLACLLHDIGVVGFIRSDHGYWGAQLLEPYVDEEVSLGDPRAPGPALLPGRVGRLQLPGDVRPPVRRGLPAGGVHPGGVQAAQETTSGT